MSENNHPSLTQAAINDALTARVNANEARLGYRVVEEQKGFTTIAPADPLGLGGPRTDALPPITSKDGVMLGECSVTYPSVKDYLLTSLGGKSDTQVRYECHSVGQAEAVNAVASRMPRYQGDVTTARKDREI